MNKILKTAAIVVALFVLFFGGFIFWFMNIDFIGHKDPQTVKRNVEAMNKQLLSARYFSDTEMCEIILTDSSHITINIGNNKEYKILFKEYHISGDTIIINQKDEENYEKEDLDKYINSRKMLVRDNKIFFRRMLITNLSQTKRCK
jgi:hypothetical protein